jgi:hypothetical protein
MIAAQEKWNLLNDSNYPDPAKLTVVDGRIEDYLKVAAT